nr:MAG TPA: hypothetical protein [Caudoviricetes sp.]
MREAKKKQGKVAEKVGRLQGLQDEEKRTCER